ncbi:UBAP1-MVB12-associated (UMA)-domain containing protein 1 [Salmo trutta]|uniref:UBAP1-MVB12-associated (UMA) domain containing 1 n=2 Tax=Salmo TaxID=8028 RepID=A0A674E5N0_SALTR|nr:UBAP1-MVB12-associated (UMA)-domain containing protein 1-like [Salmo trutta]XP_029590943.1 UBAP1-MVB12-associated (UMA)-domain containing protein 1-like [Salmo trutta]
MFSFFGHRNKDSSKKSSSEGDTDGFVIIGETVEEQRQKIQNVNISKPSCNVIVQPSKSSSATSSQAHQSPAPAPPSVIAPSPGPMWKPPAPIAEAPPSLPELLGDVPFTLAPHVLAMQTGGPGFPLFSEMLMSPRDINHNLASFTYDFTLENSVLCDH